MSPRTRALLLAVGGAVQAAAALVLLWLLPQATDETVVAWQVRAVSLSAVLTGLLVLAAGVAWAARPGPQESLPTLAVLLAVLAAAAGVLSGLLLGVGDTADGGLALAAGLMGAVLHGSCVLLAAIIRRESRQPSAPG